MKRTIPYKILCFCNGLVFFAPVSLLLRTSRGVTLSQFFLLQALLSVAIFVFEIPTGMFSDRIGHKKGILVSQILLLCARAIFLIAGNIGFFILEAVLEALSCCFISGTGEAYLYELCRNDSDSNSFVRENAKAGAYGTAGFLISTVAYAGLYRLVGLNGLVIATGLATIVSIVAAVCMPEVSPAAAADRVFKRHHTCFVWAFAFRLCVMPCEPCRKFPLCGKIRVGGHRIRMDDTDYSRLLGTESSRSFRAETSGTKTGLRALFCVFAHCRRLFLFPVCGKQSARCRFYDSAAVSSGDYEHDFV